MLVLYMLMMIVVLWRRPRPKLGCGAKEGRKEGKKERKKIVKIIERCFFNSRL
jgi:hypothetical protein